MKRMEKRETQLVPYEGCVTEAEASYVAPGTSVFAATRAKLVVTGCNKSVAIPTTTAFGL